MAGHRIYGGSCSGVWIALIVIGVVMGGGSMSGCKTGDEGEEGDGEGDAGLVINEIVAKAVNGGNDWFEVYVTGSEEVRLSDFSVVDDKEDREPAVLPDVIVQPGHYYVIQCCDDEPADESAYVPFKLGSDDCLTLFREGVTVDTLDWDEGEAPEGFSYGRLPDGGTPVGMLWPTPGDANSQVTTAGIRLNEVMVKHPSGGPDWIELYVSGSQSVSLNDYMLIDEDAEEAVSLPDVTLSPGTFFVVIATDDPDASSTNAVALNLGTKDSLLLLRAGIPVSSLAWKNGDAPEGLSFGHVPDADGPLRTLVPTAAQPNQEYALFTRDVVGEIRLEIDTSDLNAMLTNPLAEEYYPGSIVMNDIRVDDVAIRVKGNSSLNHVAGNPNSVRYSFKVDINYFDSDLRLAGLKKLNLNNGFKDPSFMRERISYDLMAWIGLPTPRSMFANLSINGELWGLYTIVEQVDDYFLERNFSNAGGDLYKADGPGGDLLWRGDAYQYYTGLELKTNEESSDHRALLAMIREINLGSAYESVFAVDLFLRYLAVSTLLTNLDSHQGPMAHNYYLYEEEGVFTMIPWDLNESFGSFNQGCTRQALLGFMIDEPTSGRLADRPLIKNLLARNNYRSDYHTHLQRLLDSPFSVQTMAQTISQTADLIRSHVYADPTKFFSNTDFERSLNADVGEIIGLNPFVIARSANVANQLSGALPAAGNGSGNCTSGPP